MAAYAALHSPCRAARSRGPQEIAVVGCGLSGVGWGAWAPKIRRQFGINHLVSLENPCVASPLNAPMTQDFGPTRGWWRRRRTFAADNVDGHKEQAVRGATCLVALTESWLPGTTAGT